MKAIGILGSPRKNGNTEILIAHALRAMSEEGVETELVRLTDYNIQPCNACQLCVREERCSIDDDLFPLYLRVKEADILVLGTPVYLGSSTALMRTFMERAGQIARKNRTYVGKVGGPLVVARRTGQFAAFAELLCWFYFLEFHIATSTYWNIAFGWNKGEVEQDEEGMKTAWNFGKNAASLAGKLRA